MEPANMAACEPPEQTCHRHRDRGAVLRDRSEAAQPGSAGLRRQGMYNRVLHVRCTLTVLLSAKERDYLVRVLRSEQASWLRAAEYRDKNPAAQHSHDQHVEFVLDAKSRAEAANAMAIMIYNARSGKRSGEDGAQPAAASRKEDL